MPSRRTVLRTAGVALAGSFAGCLGDNRVTGFVQVKSIVVDYENDGQPFSKSILKVTLGESPGEYSPQLNYLDDNWEDRFDTPRKPVVSEALHNDLRKKYDAVTYIVGVCSPSWNDDNSTGCYNAETTREDFNRVQIYDQVTASSDGSYMSIYNVEGTWPFNSE